MAGRTAGKIPRGFRDVFGKLNRRNVILQFFFSESIIKNQISPVQEEDKVSIESGKSL